MKSKAKRYAAAERAEAIDLIARFGPTAVERTLNVHYTTVRRWAAGEIIPPRAVLIALRAAVDGVMPGQEYVKDWLGWGFRDGKLHSPENEGFTPGDLRGLAFNRQLIRSLQQDVARLREKLQHELEHNNAGAANDPWIRKSL